MKIAALWALSILTGLACATFFAAWFGLLDGLFGRLFPNLK